MDRRDRKHPPNHRKDALLGIGLTALIVVPIALAYASSFDGTFVLLPSISVVAVACLGRFWICDAAARRWPRRIQGPLFLFTPCVTLVVVSLAAATYPRNQVQSNYWETTRRPITMWAFLSCSGLRSSNVIRLPGGPWSDDRVRMHWLR
jgi:hypothetical protein